MRELRLAALLPALLCVGMLCAGGASPAGDISGDRAGTVQLTVSPSR